MQMSCDINGPVTAHLNTGMQLPRPGILEVIKGGEVVTYQKPFEKEIHHRSLSGGASVAACVKP